MSTIALFAPAAALRHVLPLPPLRSISFAAAIALAPMPALADGAASLTIGAGHFEPQTVNVKAGEKIALTVRNATKEAAEFESAELNREKVIPPGGSATVYIGPLEPGSYGFFDDFHPQVTGRIVAK